MELFDNASHLTPFAVHAYKIEHTYVRTYAGKGKVVKSNKLFIK